MQVQRLLGAFLVSDSLKSEACGCCGFVSVVARYHRRVWGAVTAVLLTKGSEGSGTTSASAGGRSSFQELRTERRKWEQPGEQSGPLWDPWFLLVHENCLAFYHLRPLVRT